MRSPAVRVEALRRMIGRLNYLSDDNSSFSPQALMWALIGGGVIIFGVATYRCITIADKTREEVDKWEKNEIHYEHGAGADKLVHCVGACLVTLRAGRLCGILAARSNERAGTNPFGSFIGDPMDEKANFDGVACGDTIDCCANNPTFCRMKTPWVTGNDWLDCQSCCRQKGYRGCIKWR